MQKEHPQVTQNPPKMHAILRSQCWLAEPELDGFQKARRVGGCLPLSWGRGNGRDGYLPRPHNQNSLVNRIHNIPSLPDWVGWVDVIRMRCFSGSLVMPWWALKIIINTFNWTWKQGRVVTCAAVGALKMPALLHSAPAAALRYSSNVVPCRAQSMFALQLQKILDIYILPFLKREAGRLGKNYSEWWVL